MMEPLDGVVPVCNQMGSSEFGHANGIPTIGKRPRSTRGIVSWSHSFEGNTQGLTINQTEIEVRKGSGFLVVGTPRHHSVMILAPVHVRMKQMTWAIDGATNEGIEEGQAEWVYRKRLNHSECQE